MRTDYYESRERVKEEDILEPVRAANAVMGKKVLVFPCFEMDTLYSREDINYFYGEYLQKATQENFDRIREMLDSAVYQYPGNGYSSNPLRNILEEEAQMYYAGDATLEETVKKIQSRATMWLNEL